MRPHRNLLALASIVGLLGGGVASAEDESSLPPHWREFCKENPGKCEEARAKHKAFCQENPKQCEQMKQKRAERREWCKQNPEKCAQQSAEWKQRRAERKAKQGQSGQAPGATGHGAADKPAE